MILSEIRKYLMKQGEATLLDLSVRFDTPPEAMRDILGHWVRKGRVGKRELHFPCGKACSGCCPASARESYFWVQ